MSSEEVIILDFRPGTGLAPLTDDDFFSLICLDTFSATLLKVALPLNIFGILILLSLLCSATRV